MSETLLMLCFNLLIASTIARSAVQLQQRRPINATFDGNRQNLLKWKCHHCHDSNIELNNKFSAIGNADASPINILINMTLHNGNISGNEIIPAARGGPRRILLARIDDQIRQINDYNRTVGSLNEKISDLMKSIDECYIESYKTLAKRDEQCFQQIKDINLNYSQSMIDYEEIRDSVSFWVNQSNVCSKSAEKTYLELQQCKVNVSELEQSLNVSMSTANARVLATLSDCAMEKARFEQNTQNLSSELQTCKSSLIQIQWEKEEADRIKAEFIEKLHDQELLLRTISSDLKSCRTSTVNLESDFAELQQSANVQLHACTEDLKSCRANVLQLEKDFSNLQLKMQHMLESQQNSTLLINGQNCTLNKADSVKDVYLSTSLVFLVSMLLVLLGYFIRELKIPTRKEKVHHIEEEGDSFGPTAQNVVQSEVEASFSMERSESDDVSNSIISYGSVAFEEVDVSASGDGEITELQKEFSAVKDRLSRLSSDNNRLERDLAEAKKQIDSLEAAKEEERQRVNRMKSKNQELRKITESNTINLSEKEEEISRLKAELQRVALSLTQKVEEINDQTKRYDEYRCSQAEIVETYKQSLESSKQAFEERNLYAEKLENELKSTKLASDLQEKSLREELFAVSQGRQSLQVELDERNLVVKQLEDELATLKRLTDERILELQSQIVKANSEKDAMTVAHREDESEWRNQIETQRSVLESTKNSMQRQIGDLSEQLTATILHKDEVTADLRNQLDFSKEEFKTLQATLELRITNVNVLERELNDAKNDARFQIQLVRNELNTAVRDISNLQTDAAKKDEELMKLRESFEAANFGLQDRISTLNRLKSDFFALQVELGDRDRSLSQLRDATASLKDSKEREVEILRTQLNNAEAEAKALTSALQSSKDDWEQQLKALQSLLDATKRSLEEQIDELSAQFNVANLRHVEEVKSLLAQAEATGAAFKTVQTKLDDSRERVAALEGELSKLRAEADEANVRNGNLRSEIETSLGTINALKGEVSSRDMQISSLQKDLYDARLAGETVNADLERANSALESKEMLIVELRQRISSLAEEKVQEVEHYERELAAQQSLLSQAQLDLLEYVSDGEEKSDQIRQNQEEITRLRGELELAKASNSVNTEISARPPLEKSHGFRHIEYDKYDELKAELEEKSSQLESAMTEIAALKDSLKTLKDLKTDSPAKLQTKQNAASSWTQQLRKQFKLSPSESNSEIVRQYNEELQRQNSELDALRDSYKTLKEEKTAEAMKYEERIAQLEREIKKLDSERVQQLKDRDEELSQLRSEIESLKADLLTAQQAIELLKVELERSNTENQHLHNRYDELSKVRLEVEAELTAEIESLKLALLSSKKEAEVAAKSCDNELSTLRSELEATKTQLLSARKDIEGEYLAEIATLRDSVHVANEEKEKIYRKLLEQTEVTLKLQSDFDEAILQCNSLKQSLLEKDINLKVAADINTKLGADLEAMSESVSAEQARYEELLRVNAALERDVTRVEGDLASLAQQLLEKDRTLSYLQAEYQTCRVNVSEVCKNAHAVEARAQSLLLDLRKSFDEHRDVLSQFDKDRSGPRLSYGSESYDEVFSSSNPMHVSSDSQESTLSGLTSDETQCHNRNTSFADVQSEVVLALQKIQSLPGKLTSIEFHTSLLRKYLESQRLLAESYASKDIDLERMFFENSQCEIKLAVLEASAIEQQVESARSLQERDDQLQRLRSELEASLSKVTNITTEIEVKEAKFREEIGNLSEALKASNEDGESTKKVRVSLEMEVESLKSELFRVIRDRDDEIKRLQSESAASYEALQKSLKLKDEEFQLVVATNSQVATSLSAAQARIEELLRSNSSLESDVTRVEGNLASLAQQLLEKDRTLSYLQAEYQTCRVNVSEVCKNAQTVEARAQSLLLDLRKSFEEHRDVLKRFDKDKSGPRLSYGSESYDEVFSLSNPMHVSSDSQESVPPLMSADEEGFNHKNSFADVQSQVVLALQTIQSVPGQLRSIEFHTSLLQRYLESQQSYLESQQQMLADHYTSKISELERLIAEAEQHLRDDNSIMAEILSSIH